MILYYAYALFIGTLVIVAPMMNGQNALVYGSIKASWYNYLSASLSAVFLWFLLDGRLTFMGNLNTIPPYYFLGGLIGCITLMLFNYFTVRIRAFYIVILPFLGQMTMGLILDAALSGIFDPKRILGMFIICLGLYLQSTPKQKKSMDAIGYNKTTPYQSE